MPYLSLMSIIFNLQPSWLRLSTYSSPLSASSNENDVFVFFIIMQGRRVSTKSTRDRDTTGVQLLQRRSSYYTSFTKWDQNHQQRIRGGILWKDIPHRSSHHSISEFGCQMGGGTLLFLSSKPQSTSAINYGVKSRSPRCLAGQRMESKDLYTWLWLRVTLCKTDCLV